MVIQLKMSDLWSYNAWERKGGLTDSRGKVDSQTGDKDSIRVQCAVELLIDI